jgi:hypothetical protein
LGKLDAREVFGCRSIVHGYFVPKSRSTGECFAASSWARSIANAPE